MHRIIVTLGAAVVLAALVTTVSPTASAAPAPRDGSDAAAEHRRVEDYWTQARRDSAVPRNVHPNRRPPGGGGGGGAGAVNGATWTGGGDVVLTTGKVFFTMGGVNYVCSGSAVDTAIGAVVLTAGHCVKDGAGAFATNFAFYPAYNNGSPHPVLGGWTASDLFTTNAWGGSEDFDDDAGFAVVYRTGASSLENAIQAAGDGSVWIPPVDFSGATSPYSAFGYPAAKPYNGRTLIYCQGPLTGEIDGQPGTQSIACNMTGGSSGGPWLETFGDGTSRVSSLNSYGYQSLKGYMFGPIFGAGEQAAFDGAATGNCVGSPSGYRCVSIS
jgi:hypothetical protein